MTTTAQNTPSGTREIARVRSTVINDQFRATSGSQINTIQAPAATYYVKFQPKKKDIVRGKVVTNYATLLPYIVVYKALDSEHWIITKVNRTDRGTALTVLPITGEGEYRLYTKEPTVTPVLGGRFIIPFHALADGTNSTYEVQPWFALIVTKETNSQNVFKIKTTLPNGLKRRVNTYPITGQEYFLNQTHVTSKQARVLGDHIITDQLWSDCSQTYSKNHPSITGSPYRRILERIYGEQMINPSTEEDLTNQRILSFTSGENNATEHKIDFTNKATAGARTTLSFSSQNKMTSDEAIRRTHPTVFIYWLGIMHELKMTEATISSSWRPHLGSTLHRYSLALDITGITAFVNVNEGNKTAPEKLESVTIYLTRDNLAGKRCNPLLEINNKMSVENRRKVELSRKFFYCLARDRMSGKLGWLGGPWALKYNEPVINYNNGNDTLFIKTNDAHSHHVHLSVGIEQE